LRLPLLREREGDINILAAHFLDLAAKRLKRVAPRLSVAALAALNGHSWPGNVRELESILYRAVLLTEGMEIAASALGLHVAPSPMSITTSDIGFSSGDEFDRFGKAKALAITAFEFGYLNELIRRSNGNITLAAKISGTERRQLGKLLKKHGIIPKAAQQLQ
jgi:DNA-binding NtrC family response regulator